MFTTNYQSSGTTVVEETKTPRAEDSAEVIPYVLRVRSTDQLAQNTLSSTSPISSNSHLDQPLQSSVQVLHSSTPSNLPQTMTDLVEQMMSSPLFPTNLHPILQDWYQTFSHLREDPEIEAELISSMEVDAMAILVQEIINPIVTSYPLGSQTQSEALTWATAAEAIFSQLFPDMDFESVLDDCEELLCNTRITQAHSVSLDQTLATQREVFNEFLDQAPEQTTYFFTTLRMSLIQLHQTRRERMNEENQHAVEITQRAHQTAQQLMEESEAIAGLAERIHEQNLNTQNTLAHCRIVISRCL